MHRSVSHIHQLLRLRMIFTSGFRSGALIIQTVIAITACPGATIIDFTSNLPLGMSKTQIINPSNGIVLFHSRLANLSNLGTFTIILLWTPSASQYGTRVVCLAAIDSSNIQSRLWCVTVSVGFAAPQLPSANSILASASSVGTVNTNQAQFQIQSN